MWFHSSTIGFYRIAVIKTFIIPLGMAILGIGPWPNSTAANRLVTTDEKPQIPVSSLASGKDLVCQMKLAKAVSDTVHYAGRPFGFCSTSCKKRFQQHPAKFTN